MLTLQPPATYINYPSQHYSYPNFDYIMTEAYDWLLEAKEITRWLVTCFT
ncbi:hypothetical protein [Acinetobacter baumannii]